MTDTLAFKTDLYVCEGQKIVLKSPQSQWMIIRDTYPDFSHTFHASKAGQILRALKRAVRCHGTTLFQVLQVTHDHFDLCANRFAYDRFSIQNRQNADA